MNSLGLDEQDFSIVRDLLREHAPTRTVWAFGSRAKGLRVKKYSDLDLAVDGRMTLHEHAAISDASEESLMPIKVDVVELGAITPEFRARIEKDFVMVQEGAGPGQGEGALLHEQARA